MRAGKTPKADHEQEEETRDDSYPTYSPKEDIYSNDIHSEIDEDDLRSIKEEDIKRSRWNESKFEDDFSGSDLDVPGTEMDDEMEEIGSEDEENNFYSLDDDEEEDLEEEDKA